MSLHTPGPWLCLDGKIISHTQTTGAPIARVFKRASPHVTAANAHLVLAAPDLLAALNAALDDVDAAQAEGYEFPAWAAAAQAAVAKANGAA